MEPVTSTTSCSTVATRQSTVLSMCQVRVPPKPQASSEGAVRTGTRRLLQARATPAASRAPLRRLRRPPVTITGTIAMVTTREAIKRKSSRCVDRASKTRSNIALSNSRSSCRGCSKWQPAVAPVATSSSNSLLRSVLAQALCSRSLLDSNTTVRVLASPPRTSS